MVCCCRFGAFGEVRYDACVDCTSYAEQSIDAPDCDAGPDEVRELAVEDADVAGMSS